MASSPREARVTLDPAAAVSDAELDVYLLARAFGSNGGRLFHALPGRAQKLLTSAGFCHYLLIFRDQSGALTQFDFGPDNGADIAYRGLRKAKKLPVPGQIRETALAELPECFLHIGRTPKSLQDIRSFNRLQSTQHQYYLLNENDCRHYINRTVAFATTQSNPRVCRALLRHNLLQQRNKQGQPGLGLSDRLVVLAQSLTDLAHWPTVRFAGQASSTLLGVMLGRSLLWAKAGRTPVQVPRTAIPRGVRFAPVAVQRSPRLPSMAMHRAVAAMAHSAQAGPSTARRLGPILRHAASLGARARTSLHAAATSAACSLRRRREGGAGIAMATAAGGALRQVASRGVASGTQVSV
ncbi:hypothetical protein WJX73_010292 [Symbiochloris irregularis]|uniref:LRAT domain-containing protein n=1 Tax=Symbiochloris irregularis TaxID=706552 RepID=A0AAW1NQY3_9CHLO